VFRGDTLGEEDPLELPNLCWLLTDFGIDLACLGDKSFVIFSGLSFTCLVPILGYLLGEPSWAFAVG
jgi:hypothetical protein